MILGDFVGQTHAKSGVGGCIFDSVLIIDRLYVQSDLDFHLHTTNTKPVPALWTIVSHFVYKCAGVLSNTVFELN